MKNQSFNRVVRKTLFSLLLMSLNLVSEQAPAQDLTPKYSNEFLAIGVGAKALSLSNSVIAQVDDITASYWNPAGLNKIRSNYEIGAMHAEYFAGIAQFDFVAGAVRVDSQSVLALSAIRFGIDDIPDTRFLFDAGGAINYDAVRYFSAADYAFLISFARSNFLIPHLDIGSNFKVIYRNVGQFATAWGGGFDVGAQYLFKGWKLGAVARDVTTTFNSWFINQELLAPVYLETANEIPGNSVEITLPRILLGVNRSVTIIDSLFYISPELGFDITLDGKRNTLIKTNLASINPHLGLQLDYKKIVYLRMGVGNYQRIRDFDGKEYTSIQPNLGLGIKIKSVKIDYALTDAFNLSEALFSNVFSLVIALNK